MLDIFNYQFMTRAFIVGGLLSVILPCMGMPILLKRLSSMGDTLAHSSLAGVSIGLFTGIHPILGSIVACIVASLSIEFIRNKLKAYQEISTVIILAASVGLAGIFSSFSNGGNTIASYLFGSIITISDSEFYLVIFISLIVLISYKLIYTKLYLLIFDAENANILGINNKTINFIITFLSAISISISAKTIGSLIVSSLLIIPCILAMQFCKTYKNTLIISIIFSICFIYAGLVISYYYDLKPGSVIVLISVITLLMTLIIKRK